jgi:hypothetical protein
LAKDSKSSMIDRARDELFSHIQRCGVLDAEEEQRDEWLVDTIEYLSERFPGLSRDDLTALRMMGQRYCSPAIRRSPVEEAVEDVVDSGVDESTPAEPEVTEAAEAAEVAGEDDAAQPGEVNVA